MGIFFFLKQKGLPFRQKEDSTKIQKGCSFFLFFPNI
jgi:hypothetical protein